MQVIWTALPTVCLGLADIKKLFSLWKPVRYASHEINVHIYIVHLVS